MAETLRAPIRGEITHRLADLNGVYHDLRWVSGLCAQLLRMHEDPGKLDQVAEAMEIAAIIRYCRAYGGVRRAFEGQNEMLAHLSAELQEHHRFIGDLRDKHIAHSVNDWELNIPTALLEVNATTGQNELRGIGCEHHRIIGLDSERMEALRQLAQQVADMVEHEINLERARVFEHVFRTISIPQLEEAAQAERQVPGQRRVDKARGR